MRAFVDRFEGEWAVLETEEKKILNVRRREIPLETREGDGLLHNGDSWTVDLEGTQRRKEQVESLARELWDK